MKNILGSCSFLLWLVFLNTACDKDGIDSFSLMNAEINGEQIDLKPDKAKIYVGDSGRITILGRNCSKDKVVVILEVPAAVGDYTLFEEGSDMSFFRNSPLACSNESGSLNERNVTEARVSVTEVTNQRIKGTFSMVAGSFDPQITAVNTIENGVFDVERGEILE